MSVVVHLFTFNNIYRIVTGATRRAGNALSGTPDFTRFGEFMISPIHYIYTSPRVSRCFSTNALCPVHCYASRIVTFFTSVVHQNKVVIAAELRYLGKYVDLFCV